MSKTYISKENPKFSEVSFRDQVIVVEGIDGSGKTSLVDKLVAAFRAKYEDVFPYRQPGGTPLGEKIRGLLKDPSLFSIDPRVKHMLLETARMDQLIWMDNIKVNLPDAWFILDRHLDSSWAYQGTEGVSSLQIRNVQMAYSSSMKNLPVPDLTIFLDVDVDVAISRIKARGGNVDGYDISGKAFFTECILRYGMRIHGNRNKYLVVDANKSEDEVWSFVKQYLEI